MSEPTLKDVLSAIAQMQGSITQMQGDITQMQGDITQMQGSITQMQGSITQMQGDIVRLEKGQSEIRAEMATKSELAKVDAKIDATREGLKADIATTRDTLKADIANHRRETSEHRRETAQSFTALDAELGGHSEKTHRALEERLDRLEARLPAARRVSRAPRRG